MIALGIAFVIGGWITAARATSPPAANMGVLGFWVGVALLMIKALSSLAKALFT